MLTIISEIEKTNQTYTQFITEIDAKMEALVEQIINHIKREREEELHNQLVANPSG
jgi:anaerobic ribonucleoside-triphosphate reductase